MLEQHVRVLYMKHNKTKKSAAQAECLLLPLTASPQQHQLYLPLWGKLRHDLRLGHTHTHTHTHTQTVESVAVETVMFLQQWSFLNRAVRTTATAGRITYPHIHILNKAASVNTVVVYMSENIF